MSVARNVKLFDIIRTAYPKVKIKNITKLVKNITSEFKFDIKKSPNSKYYRSKAQKNKLNKNVKSVARHWTHRTVRPNGVTGQRIIRNLKRAHT